jgi:hypothetical protein
MDIAGLSVFNLLERGEGESDGVWLFDLLERGEAERDGGWVFDLLIKGDADTFVEYEELLDISPVNVTVVDCLTHDDILTDLGGLCDIRADELGVSFEELIEEQHKI